MSNLTKDLKSFLNGLLDPKLKKRYSAARGLKSRWLSEKQTAASMGKSTCKNLANNLLSYDVNYLSFSPPII